MTNLVERLREAYAAVALWPENRIKNDVFENIGDGFLDLLKVRNLVPAAADRIEALERENAELRESLRGQFCPRPCNHRPAEFDVGDCVDAGECGCGANHALAGKEGE